MLMYNTIGVKGMHNKIMKFDWAWLWGRIVTIMYSGCINNVVSLGTKTDPSAGDGGVSSESCVKLNIL